MKHLAFLGFLATFAVSAQNSVEKPFAPETRIEKPAPAVVNAPSPVPAAIEANPLSAEANPPTQAQGEVEAWQSLRDTAPGGGFQGLQYKRLFRRYHDEGMYLETGKVSRRYDLSYFPDENYLRALSPEAQKKIQEIISFEDGEKLRTIAEGQPRLFVYIDKQTQNIRMFEVVTKNGETTRKELYASLTGRSATGENTFHASKKGGGTNGYSTAGCFKPSFAFKSKPSSRFGGTLRNYVYIYDGMAAHAPPSSKMGVPASGGCIRNNISEILYKVVLKYGYHYSEIHISETYDELTCELSNGQNFFIELAPDRAFSKVFELRGNEKALLGESGWVINDREKFGKSYVFTLGSIRNKGLNTEHFLLGMSAEEQRKGYGWVAKAPKKDFAPGECTYDRDAYILKLAQDTSKGAPKVRGGVMGKDLLTVGVPTQWVGRVQFATERVYNLKDPSCVKGPEYTVKSETPVLCRKTNTNTAHTEWVLLNERRAELRAQESKDKKSSPSTGSGKQRNRK